MNLRRFLGRKRRLSPIFPWAVLRRPSWAGNEFRDRNYLEMPSEILASKILLVVQLGTE
jgi:hypothetical protein